MKKPTIGILAIILSAVCFIVLINQLMIAYYSFANYKYMELEYDKNTITYSSAWANHSTEIAFETTNLTTEQQELKRMNYAITDLRAEVNLNEDLHSQLLFLERYRIHSALAILALFVTMLFIFVAIFAWKTYVPKVKNK